MTASLHLTKVSRTHEGAATPVLSDLDLHVGAGDALAILGPSGSGKTTVLRLVAGLDAPDGGDIRIDGVSVLARPPEQRGIAMVAQRPRLFPHMSVLDNVAFGPLMGGASRREARRTAEQFLDLVQLPGLARRRPTTLSGGSSSASPWRGRWPPIPPCSCSTSRSAPSTRACELTCTSCCSNCGPSSSRRSCW